MGIALTVAMYENGLKINVKKRKKVLTYTRKMCYPNQVVFGREAVAENAKFAKKAVDKIWLTWYHKTPVQAGTVPCKLNNVR